MLLQRTLGKRGLMTLLRVLEWVVLFATPMLLIEGTSRLVHWGAQPMVPFVTDADLGTRLPSSFDAMVKLPEHPPVRLCTDAAGLRVGDCSALDKIHRIDVLSVGDSQVLGWGIAFDQTFSALVVHGLSRPGTKSPVLGLMAAASTDVELLHAWARDYQPSPMSTLQLTIITLNLGNNLDEMYYRRGSVLLPPSKLAEWMMRYSFAMQDYVIGKAWLTGAGPQLPPGANPVLFALSARERDVFVDAVADAIERLSKALPTSERTVVLLLPNDYEIDLTEFEKYRPFYSDEKEFLAWRRRAPRAVKLFTEFEERLASRLRAQGYIVVQPHALLLGNDPVRLFDRGSHHYRTLGQRLLAEAVLQALRR